MRTLEPSSNVAFMPTSARSPTVHPCKLAWWPIVTMLPMVVFAEWPARYALEVRMTQPSCTLVFSPIVMLPLSAAESVRYAKQALRLHFAKAQHNQLLNHRPAAAAVAHL
jgi:hypothetical protein